jgi:DNA-binding Xre family transcriptional regulator
MEAINWEWNARKVMADRGMYKTSDLIEPLRAHGIDISREQIYRIVTGKPRRLNVDVLMALCLVLKCETTDLLRNVPAKTAAQRVGLGAASPTGSATSYRDTELPYPVQVHGLG